MPDRQKMYSVLCVAASEALEVLPETAENAAGRDILQKALYEAEEIYIATTDDPIQDQQGKFVYDIVEKMLNEFPADRVYSAIFQLRGKMKYDL